MDKSRIFNPILLKEQQRWCLIFLAANHIEFLFM